MSLILIRYGELALKSHKVRRRFEEHLIEEISRRLDRLDLKWMIEREQGRIFLHSSEKDLTKAIFVLRHVPGIFSVSPVRDFEIHQGMESIVSETARFAQEHLSPGQTFVVRARRAGSHAFTSQEAAALSGERILDTIPDMKVKMKDADVTIHLEIRGRRGFLFTEQFRGMGGLPQGSQGKVILLLSGDHSLAAGYLIMKRGCSVIPIHFKGAHGSSLTPGNALFDGDPTEPSGYREHDGSPGIGSRSLDDAHKAFKLLNQFDPGMELISLDSDIDPTTIRQLMRDRNAQAVVTGHRYHGFDPSFRVGNEPVFFPLIGLPEERTNEIVGSMEEYYRSTVQEGA